MRYVSYNPATLCRTLLLILVVSASTPVNSPCQTRVDAQAIGKRATVLIYHHGRAPVTPDSPPDATAIGVFSGTAFCITNTGYYITNAHVVKRAKAVIMSVSPHTAGMKTYGAEVIAVDYSLDLALLKAPVEAGIEPLRLANTSEIVSGLHVTGFGFPAADPDGQASEFSLFTPSNALRVGSGHISSLYGKGNVLQDFVMDTGFVHGASGGPVLDDRGRLVGVIQMMIADSRKNVAISVNTLSGFLNRPSIQSVLNKPEMLFTAPQSITFANAAHGATFTLKCVTPSGVAPSGLKANLVLASPGEVQHAYSGTRQGGNTFNFTLAGVTSVQGPHLLSVGLSAGYMAKSQATNLQILDGQVTVGTRSLKLSDIAQLSLEDRAAPFVVLKTGEAIYGQIQALSKLHQASGAGIGASNLEKAKIITIIDRFALPTSLDYHVTLASGTAVIGSKTGHISVDALPLRHMGRSTVIVAASATPTNSTGSATTHAHDLATASKQYIVNVLDELLGGARGSVLIWSDHWEFGAAFQEVVQAAGNSVKVSLEPGPLDQYDAIFVGGHTVDQKALADYVGRGGKVYLSGSSDGTGWNEFLYRFGVAYADQQRDSTFEATRFAPVYLFKGISSLTVANVRPLITRLDTGAETQIIANQGGMNLWAIYHAGNSRPAILPEAVAFHPNADPVLVADPTTVPTDIKLHTVLFDEATGHAFYEVEIPARTPWEAANAMASSLTLSGVKGHLLTIASKQKADFVRDRFHDVVSGRGWLGAYRDTKDGKAKDSGGWRWVTDEHWFFTQWRRNSPSHVDAIKGSDYLRFGDGMWVDSTNESDVSRFVVEFDKVAEPERIALHINLRAVEIERPDTVLINDKANELEHQFHSDKSIVATRLGFIVRDAPEGGWFSYVLRCSPKNPSLLTVYYLGGDANGRDYDVLVDGTKALTLSLKPGARGLSTVQSLQIPAELTKSKEHVEIRFVSRAGNDTCGIHTINLSPDGQRKPVQDTGKTAVAGSEKASPGLSPTRPHISVKLSTVIDKVDIGNDVSEKDHDLKGDNTRTAAYIGRQWRSAFDGGWFSYTMQVKPDKQNFLSITYYGGDGGGRDFDILIDGQKLVEVSLQVRFGGNVFYPRQYELPQSLTNGKTSVVVTFKDHPGNIAGGIYGCATVIIQ